MGESDKTPIDEARNDYLALDDRGLLAQCTVETYRARGPGGQKRNKTDSAVRLRHRPTLIAVIATESRSQHENRVRALKRMRLAIAIRVRRPVEPDQYKPGADVVSCLTKSGVLRVGKKDRRYLAVAAEVLDLLAACRGEVSTTARKIGISTANLVSFLQGDEKLWARVNQMRTGIGLRPLR